MFLPTKRDTQIHLGITIVPPPPVVTQLRQALSAGWSGCNLAGYTPHVTLAGPVAVLPAEVPFVLARARQLLRQLAPFALRLGGVGDFRPISPVVYLPVLDGSQQCYELSRLLRFGPLQGSDRFPYVPHLTLAHGHSDEVLNQVATVAEKLSFVFDVNQVVVDQILPGSLVEIAQLSLGGEKQVG